jgi:hypothetical protein
VPTSSKGHHYQTSPHIEHANALFQEDQLTTSSSAAEMLNISHIWTCNSQQKNRTAVNNCSLAPRQFSQKIKTIRNHKCEVLPHAPCSPDLSLYDFHAFGPFKEAFSGRRCGSDKVVEAVHKWIRKQPKTCFSDGIRKPCGWLQTVCGTWWTLCWKITNSLFYLFVVRKEILPLLSD